MQTTKLIAAYRLHKSLKKASSLCHLPVSTSRLALKAAGVVLRPRGAGHMKGKKQPPRVKTSRFAQWVRKNPGPLPRDLTKLARMSGCSKDTIKCFLYRLRKSGKAVPLLRKMRRKSIRSGLEQTGAPRKPEQHRPSGHTRSP